MDIHLQLQELKTTTLIMAKHLSPTATGQRRNRNERPTFYPKAYRLMPISDILTVHVLAWQAHRPLAAGLAAGASGCKTVVENLKEEDLDDGTEKHD